MFEEKISGKLNTDDRPALLEALSHIRDGDMLTVQEVDQPCTDAITPGVGRVHRRPSAPPQPRTHPPQLRPLNYPALLWGLGQLREEDAVPDCLLPRLA